ncbi:hypothetical protein CUU64_12935 [Bacillus sp. V5-8f]|nr:hypothetical protein CUU64_12935 [Bacillus sp. V5-8f]
MTKRERRTFTDEFKNQMVQLYPNGKQRKDIIREYDLTPSSLCTFSFPRKPALQEQRHKIRPNILVSSFYH